MMDNPIGTIVCPHCGTVHCGKLNIVCDQDGCGKAMFPQYEQQQLRTKIAEMEDSLLDEYGRRVKLIEKVQKVIKKCQVSEDFFLKYEEFGKAGIINEIKEDIKAILEGE